MNTFRFNPLPEELLTGEIDFAILIREKPRLYVAWSKTKEGPARFDYPAAQADLRDLMQGKSE